VEDEHSRQRVQDLPRQLEQPRRRYDRLILRNRIKFSGKGICHMGEKSGRI
jgi:hypothetical protein